MCPLLSSKARPGRLTLSVSSLSRRKYLLDQGYLIKKNKELNTRLHQFPYLWVRTGQTEWPLKLPHDSDKKYKKYRRKLCFRNQLTTWWFDGCRLSGDCNERERLSLARDDIGTDHELWHTRLRSWYQCLDRAPSLMIMSVCETSGCNETKNIVNSGLKSRPRIKFLCSTISVQSRQSKTGTGDWITLHRMK